MHNFLYLLKFIYDNFLLLLNLQLKWPVLLLWHECMNVGKQETNNALLTDQAIGMLAIDADIVRMIKTSLVYCSVLAL